MPHVIIPNDPGGRLGCGAATPPVEKDHRMTHRFTARFLPSLLMSLPLLLAGCAATRMSVENAPKAEQIAPGVYAVLGALEEPAPANRGVVGNYGILVGETGVVLIETGTSARYAQRMLEDLRKLTDKPVLLAINTHQSPAFVFGNGTLVEKGVPIVAHREVDALIAARCARCLKLLQTALGPVEMEGSKVVRPTQLIDGTTTLTVGGRTIDLLYYGPTSSPGSLAVYDRESGTLFTGGMASIDRIPDVKDGDFPTWRRALEEMRRLQPKRVVPGEGPVSSPARLSEMDKYLELVMPATQEAFRKRLSLTQAPAAAELPSFRHWALYDTVHKKNVEQLYLRLEKESFNAK